MNYAKSAGIFLILLTAAVSSQTWQVQPNPAIGDIIQIHAIDANTAYALTTKQILKTTDGGTIWEEKLLWNLTGLGNSFNGFQWLNANTGYAWFYAGNKYIKTTNGGTNWTETILPSGTGYMDFFNGGPTIYFNNSGYSGTGFFYTTNSGANWYSRNTAYGNMNTLTRMYFINESTGFMNGGSSYTFYHVILRTSDAGFSWTPVMNSGTDGYGSGGDFKFFGGIGYHISNKTYKTTNYGENWITLNNQGGGVRALFMHNVDRGWLGKQNGLLKTTDGCVTWVNQNIGVSNVDINSVSFVNFNTGWIAGESAHILKTTNGSGVLAPTVPPVGVSPPNNSNGHSLTPILVWNPVPTATNYRVQISVDLFSTILLDYDTVSITQFQVPSGFLNHNIQYYWRIAGVNIGGQGPWSVVWNFRTGLVGLNQTGNEIPSSFKLYDNYPNPFNPVTNIKFDIPKSSYVKINIYDASGRLVTELVNQYLSAGSYVSQFNFSEFSSGVYYYRIESGVFTDVKKMVLVK